ncbi:hypothetical protein QJQ45_012439 [Haematococcus lacustris]|nr:hypothetical protein QJQ45_012439 [Haematococcus lacustris]
MLLLICLSDVSLIKPYTGTDVGFLPPPVEWLDEEPVYYVERLLDHRHVHAGKAKEYMVQWEGYDADHNTWEPRSNLVGCDKILAEYNAAHNLKVAKPLHLQLEFTALEAVVAEGFYVVMLFTVDDVWLGRRGGVASGEPRTAVVVQLDVRHVYNWVD